MNIVRLTSCNNVIEAHLIKGKLNNEGIECFITNENIATLKPHYYDNMGFGIDIMINENDLERASQIINSQVAAESKPRVCPHCGSDCIGIRYRTNRVAKYFFVILAMAFAKSLGDANTIYYCKLCKKKIRSF